MVCKKASLQICRGDKEMKYYVRYELQLEAENDKKLFQKLSLIEHHIRMKDKHFTREIVDDEDWYIQPLEKKLELNDMEL